MVSLVEQFTFAIESLVGDTRIAIARNPAESQRRPTDMMMGGQQCLTPSRRQEGRPFVARSSRCLLEGASSLPAKDAERVDAAGTPRGQIARHGRDGEQDGDGGRETRGIDRSDSE